MLVRKSNKYYFSQISFKMRGSLLLRNYETQTTRWLFAPLFFFDRIPDNSIEFDMTIKESVSRRDGEIEVAPPKTRNSIRRIVVPKQAVDLLLEEHSQHPKNPYMFPSPVTGTMYDPDAVGRIHKKLLKEAGLEDCRFHDLRHTFATLALQNGVDIKTLSGILGHSSSGFTLDTYTHVTTKMQQEAANKMGQFMKMKL